MRSIESSRMMFCTRLSRERSASVRYPGRNSRMGEYATSDSVRMKSISMNATSPARILAGERCMCHSSVLSVALSMLNRRLRNRPRHHARMVFRNFISPGTISLC